VNEFCVFLYPGNVLQQSRHAAHYIDHWSSVSIFSHWEKATAIKAVSYTEPFDYSITWHLLRKGSFFVVGGAVAEEHTQVHTPSSYKSKRSCEIVFGAAPSQDDLEKSRNV